MQYVALEHVRLVGNRNRSLLDQELRPRYACSKQIAIARPRSPPEPPAGAVRAAEAEHAVRGLVVVGFYHSHPDAPARPSPYDLEHATWPWLSYVIVAARSGQAEELTSWVLADDRAAFLPEEIRNGAGAAPDRPEGRSE